MVRRGRRNGLAGQGVFWPVHQSAPAPAQPEHEQQGERDEDKDTSVCMVFNADSCSRYARLLAAVWSVADRPEPEPEPRSTNLDVCHHAHDPAP
jgi:hypothetical protein